MVYPVHEPKQQLATMAADGEAAQHDQIA